MALDKNSSLREVFNKEYAKLNHNQRKAVDDIYGPIMIVAGPGTGKTQLLALRICNILIQTDVYPQNILCLTFTDAGSHALRNRLIQFIGADAYLVGIYTYHGFCNKVIKENSEYFGEFKELSVADDLQKIEITLDILQNLPFEHPIRRNTGKADYDTKKIVEVFSTMKKENWSPELIEEECRKYKDYLKKFDHGIRYKNSKKGVYEKGDLNERLLTEKAEKIEFVRHSAPLLLVYNQKLKEQNLIDLDDSVKWVVEKFDNNMDIKLKYQEQYQFLLADEYQDTNGSQNDIIFQLCDYDEAPNVCVVGDDDQSIYRFQGASMFNIVNFKDKFNPKTYVLDVNYRSQQEILDKAMLLISYNKERLVENYKELNKNLSQGTERIEGNFEPQIKKYANTLAQNIGLISEINKLVASGVAYSDIAIIYRKHIEIADIVKYFTKKNIPIEVKKKVNILNQPDIQKMMTLLGYITNEYKYKDSQRSKLFEILHYDFFNLKAVDIGKLSVYCSKMQENEEEFISWRELLSNTDALMELQVGDIDEFKKTGNILDELIKSVGNVTPQVLYEKCMTATGFMDQVIKSPQTLWRLQVLNKFFDFIKEETAKDERMDINVILSRIESMVEFSIEIPIINSIGSGQGINFMTAHGAKGMEYDHVFIINAIDEVWNKQIGGSKVKFPDSLVLSSGQENEEDARRLFYVALTRAKKHVYFTIPRVNSKLKENKSLKFFAEMNCDIQDIKEEQIDEILLQDFLFEIQTTAEKFPQLIEKDLINQIIAKLTINATGVSKYMECSIKFYFENILRVPMARTAAPGYGNALHYALDKFTRDIEKSPQRTIPQLSVLHLYFEKGMEKFKSHFTKIEFESHKYEGLQTLSKYYEQGIDSFKLPLANKTEYRISANHNEIPLSGIIDRIAIFDDHVLVYDYKTGKENSLKTRVGQPNKLGGSFWVQSIFYKILLDKDIQFASKLKKAYLVFLNKTETEIKEISLTQSSVDMVKDAIEFVYQGIKNHEFNNGCRKCNWCAFVDNTMGIDEVLNHKQDEDINEDLEIEFSDFGKLM